MPFLRILLEKLSSKDEKHWKAEGGKWCNQLFENMYQKRKQENEFAVYFDAMSILAPDLEICIATLNVVVDLKSTLILLCE